uniref:CAP-Gly domain-containing protein n=1 Tax=Clastoptera arizonana TaxID=38151 RepID=A0A1B6CDQ1_9HEMI
MDFENNRQVCEEVFGEKHSLDTVRALHQTVVALRAALEQSRAELHSLRQQLHVKVDTSIFKQTIEKLSLENHVLRERVLSSENINIDSKNVQPSIDKFKLMEPQKVEDIINVNNKSPTAENTNGLIEEGLLENGDDTEKSVFEDGDQSISSSTSHPGTGTPKVSKGESEDSEELDDIELIFTTDDTKELSGLQEDLVSIAETETWQPKPFENKESNNYVSNATLKHIWTQSVLVETDISKCGVIDENENPSQISRRNTLPNALPYRPIIHREALTGSKSHLLDPAPTSPRPLIVKFSQNSNRSPRNIRPILTEKNSRRQESEAQTDISALPAHWRSESYLAHNKISHNFTTLPSKFAFPVQQFPPRKQSLKLSEKTQEARRVLLSDINFTSMVPELSRSADHLYNEAINASILCKNYPRAFTYMKNADSVMSPGYLGQSPWSPCDCSFRQHSWEYYQGSLITIPSPSTVDLTEKRRHSMKPSTSSLDTYWTNSYIKRPNWSTPTSPTHKSRSFPFSPSYTHATTQSDLLNSYSLGARGKYCDQKFHNSFTNKSISKYAPSLKARNRVTFKDTSSRRSGQSLPDLRFSFGNESGEDSTDSLIDESEEFLRRSIDSMFAGMDYSYTDKKKRSRRHSDPDPHRGFEPPRSAHPFLAKIPRDLKLDFWVKVITSEARVVVGKVKYVGPLPGCKDMQVGVQLPRADGNSDGTYQGRRFFDCESNCAIFVPFKKVVLAWSP